MRTSGEIVRRARCKALGRLDGINRLILTLRRVTSICYRMVSPSPSWNHLFPLIGPRRGLFHRRSRGIALGVLDWLRLGFFIRSRLPWCARNTVNNIFDWMRCERSQSSCENKAGACLRYIQRDTWEILNCSSL